MFGTVIYEQGNYQELLLADENNVRLVLCIEGTAVKLYRIEWEDRDASSLNSAQYDIVSAVKAFREAVELVNKPEPADERPFDTFKQIEALEAEAYRARIDEQKPLVQYGTCLQCERGIIPLNQAGICEACVLEAMIDK